MAIDLAGIPLILILATVLTLAARRSRRELQDSLSATRATNEALEAAVAERTEHLLAAHAEIRHSTAVMQNTFNSMAEAVLVIDAKGEVVLSNPAAENLLRYRPGMTVELMRSLSTVFHADGITPLLVDDMPASRALRGEEFDATEMVVRPVSGNRTVHLVISGRPLRDASGAITGAALVYHDITPIARNRTQAAAIAEDGRHRPAHRRRRARLQQHADRHHRHHRDAGRQACRTCRRCRRPPS